MTMHDMLAATASETTERPLHATWQLLRLSSDDPRATADPAVVRPLMGLAWLVYGVIIAAMLPVAPPVDQIGDAGWAIGATVVASSLAIANFLVRSPTHRDPLLLTVLAYVGLGLLALTEWLAGSHGETYNELYLLWGLAAAATLPPRRATVFFAALAATVMTLGLVLNAAQLELVALAIRVTMWSALSTMALVVAVAFRGQRAALQREGALAHHLARVDILTGLGNRRAFDEAMALEVARAERSGHRLSIGVFDIRDFKSINDQHGHLRGDDCLRAVAAALREATRAGNMPFRWGGDEFAVLLPDAGHDAAITACARLAEQIAATCRRPDAGALTVRFGAAERGGASTAAEMLERADAMLIALKESEGRVAR